MIWPLLRAIFLREWAQSLRQPADVAWHALFFVVVSSLFPLSLEPDPDTLRLLAPGVLWVAALLAGLLSLDTLFRGDAEDGSLEQWLLSPVPLPWLVAVRVFSHWLTTAFPLVLVSPLLAELMQLPRAQLPVLVASLALGTPLLSLLGAVVAALTVGMRRSGILLALLVLPLYVPVLVFGAGAVSASAQGFDAGGALLLLGAGLVLSLVLAPPTAAAALRIAHT